MNSSDHDPDAWREQLLHPSETSPYPLQPSLAQTIALARPGPRPWDQETDILWTESMVSIWSEVDELEFDSHVNPVSRANK